MQEQLRAVEDVGAELPVHIPIRVSFPGDGAGSAIHKTAGWKGGGTPQHWVMIFACTSVPHP